MSKSCIIDGCVKPAKKRDYCVSHYARWLRNGDPLGGRITPGTTLQWVKDVALAYEGDECLIWPFGQDGAGYGSMHIEGKHIRASRFICIQVNGEPPDPTFHAAHSCGKGGEGCVTKRHLRWASPQENAMDKFDHGTLSRGENVPNSKLTADIVSVVRAIPEEKISHQELADRFNVSREQIRRVRKGTTWTWLQPTPIEEVVRAALATEGKL